MQVLNLIRLVWGWGFLYMSRIHTAYIGFRTSILGTCFLMMAYIVRSACSAYPMSVVLHIQVSNSTMEVSYWEPDMYTTLAFNMESQNSHHFERLFRGWQIFSRKKEIKLWYHGPKWGRKCFESSETIGFFGVKTFCDHRRHINQKKVFWQRDFYVFFCWLGTSTFCAWWYDYSPM